MKSFKLPLKILLGLSIVKDTFSLIKLEANYARRSLRWCIGLLIFLLAILASTWLIILAILFYLFINLSMSVLTALFTLLLINIVMMAGIYWVMTQLQANLTFPATRRQLRII